ncbi:MAG TPA: quinone oxidoreductase [Ktedonobacterales bacterium]|jgi:NADPH2:quinone reductase|nr:quinone oxidoreductase [Ktedonobacterales bacterium]
MRAIQIEQPGGPEVLKMVEAPIPEPGPGQARVKMAAAGLNFIEIYQRMGQYKLPLPFTPGGEGAGVVDAVGSGVTEVQVGDRVATSAFMGAYAEYAIANAWQLAKVPEGVDLKVAAASMLQGMTAHYLSHSTYPLKQGEPALIYAAAGGVGGLLTQMAKMLGARTLCTVGSESKVAEARSLGADEVILYRQVDIAQEVRRLTDGKGVPVVYDSVGKDTFDASLDSLARRGYMVLYGQSSGPVEPVNPQILNSKGSLFLTRPTLVHYIATPEEFRSRSGALLGWISEGKLRVRIARTFPLAQAGDAQAYLASGQAMGKILLEI